MTPLEMTEDLNGLLKKWQIEGHDPVVCTYSILMRFSAVACGLVEEDDLMMFLDDARKKGFELYEKAEWKDGYAH